MKGSILQMLGRPIYVYGMIFIPLFLFIMLTSLMSNGLPTQVPAAIVDRDGTSMSRSLSQTLAGMQMVDITAASESYSEARHLMQEGKIYGFFLIPENFERDLLAGRKPVISFYTNMTYYVPGTLLFKTFKSTATYAKAGIISSMMQSVGLPDSEVASLIQPVVVETRPIGNPQLNYAIYLCNSFIPAILQLMILLMTCYTLGEEIKKGSSVRLLHLADGSIIKALFAKLLPQTCLWIIIAMFMESWLFCWNEFPMHGSWGWLTLSEIMFVLASQGLAIFFFGIIPNLRLSLSISSLIGILTFSIAAFSFPVESMYPAIGIFSWIVPVRYNFLIYIDQALNGIHVYYSRIWFVAYIIFMLLPFSMLWNIKKNFKNPVYVP